MNKALATGPSWLAQAMRDLAGIDVEAAEEGLPKISAKAKIEAGRILSKLAGCTAIEPIIYPTLYGEIAIQFNAPSQARAVFIELGSDGEATCFASIDGRNRRARYSDSSELPDQFIEAQVSTLAPSSASGKPYGLATS